MEHTPSPSPARRPGRAGVLAAVAEHLAVLRPGHVLRVAVDGVTAAGKTTFADELAVTLTRRGRPVVRISMDGYHHPRAHRYRQGRGSADGYYEDAYDLSGFARHVLAPLGPHGNGTYRPRILDLAADLVVDDPPVPAPQDAVLVVDGSFLQREELAGGWDQVVFLDTGLEVARDRGTRRDAAALGGPEQAGRAYDERYHAACRRYLAEVDPRTRADVVIANDDLDRPVLVRIRT